MWLRHLVRCRFFIWHQNKERCSALHLNIIAIVGYFITRSEDKKKERQKKINDRINDSRSMLKDSIVKRAVASQCHGLYKRRAWFYMWYSASVWRKRRVIRRQSKNLILFQIIKWRAFGANGSSSFQWLLDNQERQRKRDDEEAANSTKWF